MWPLAHRGGAFQQRAPGDSRPLVAALRVSRVRHVASVSALLAVGTCPCPLSKVTLRVHPRRSRPCHRQPRSTPADWGCDLLPRPRTRDTLSLCPRRARPGVTEAPLFPV